MKQKQSENSQLQNDTPSKPRVVISKCLGFAACRYNGQEIRSGLVEKLKGEMEFIPVCPEVEIGLGIPREPIRIIEENGEKKLIQPATGKELSETMRKFSTSFLRTLDRVDGFLLKNRSPSCGFTDVKIYAPGEKGMTKGKGSGFFGEAVLKNFPSSAVEDEGRLLNFRIREHYLTKVFTLFRFRNAMAGGSIKELIDFHSNHKYLFMSYSQKALKDLGKITASYRKGNFPEIKSAYETRLGDVFLSPPRITSNINVLMHTLGYFSKQLSSEEKGFFLDSLTNYREGKVPLSVPLYLIASWVNRFGEDYLKRQYFFEPYPVTLMEITDSGKGRDL